MNEYNNIEFPADFDDLSKHAPLLNKLRVKGSGMIVPENYFSESLDFSNELCKLSVVHSDENAFTLPLNYFEELAERIINIVNLNSIENRASNSNSSFIIPDGYFEKLINEINSVVSLSDLKKSESFEIPENYFNQLDATINTKIALDNLKQDEGFGVPENYFENFADKILTKVAVDELNHGSDAEIPVGYFDTLADRITLRIAQDEGVSEEKVTERGRIIVFAEVIKRYARPISIAASVTLILGVSIWFFNRSNDISNDKNVIVKTDQPKEKNIPVIPTPKKDTVNSTVPNNNVAVQKPKNNNRRKVNPTPTVVVKEVEKQDVLAQLDLIDENMVADFVNDNNPDLNDVPEENSLNDDMLKYLLDNNTDPSDIK